MLLYWNMASMENNLRKTSGIMDLDSAQREAFMNSMFSIYYIKLSFGWW